MTGISGKVKWIEVSNRRGNLRLKNIGKWGSTSATFAPKKCRNTLAGSDEVFSRFEDHRKGVEKSSKKMHDQPVDNILIIYLSMEEYDGRRERKTSQG
jgi:hypothetical protein